MSNVLEGRLKYWTLVIALSGVILSQAWNLRVFAKLPEEVIEIKGRVKDHDQWIKNHESEVVIIRLDLERRLSRIESKIDLIIRSKGVNAKTADVGVQDYELP